MGREKIVLKERYQRLLERVDSVARSVHRSPNEVSVMAVTKLRSRSEVEEAYSLGMRLFGENRVFEARDKFANPPEGIQLHMIGHLQSNKAKVVAPLFDCVQSIDSESTATVLDGRCGTVGRIVSILIEVNTSGEATKGGVVGEAPLYSLVEKVLSLENIRLGGVMTMAPFTEDKSTVRECFRGLRSIRDTLAARYPRGDFSTLSMGMSSDFEIAIEEGSTMIRVGTSLFEGGEK